jgi:hypothetical protein
MKMKKLKRLSGIVNVKKKYSIKIINEINTTPSVEIKERNKKMLSLLHKVRGN